MTRVDPVEGTELGGIVKSFRRDSVWSRAIPASILVFLLACAAFAAAAGFRQSHNDFWDVYFVAVHLSPDDVLSWFNPQYPVGYTLLLRVISGAGGDPAAPAILFNIGVSAAILWIASRFYLRILPPAFTLLAVFFLAVFFEFFRYGNAAGGDPGSVLFFTAGAALALAALAGDPGRDPIRRMLAAGWLLGAAALFRYHALPAAALFGMGVFVAWPRRWVSVLALGVGAAGAYSLQWAVNLAAGRGLLETQFGPMNVYDLMYGVNWHRITSLDLSGGVGEIIAADPALFFGKYLAAFWSFKQVWAPPVLALALVRDAAKRRLFLALSVWITAYFLLFSATTSGRQSLIPLPFSMLALAAAVQAVWRRLATVESPQRRTAARAAVVAVLAALAALHIHRDRIWLADRAAQHTSAKALESRLIAAGAASAREVFTSDFDLYFQKLEWPIPYFNGGAPRLGTYRYNEVYPEFPVESLEAFAVAARARGVRFLVLNKDADKLSEPMGALHESGELVSQDVPSSFRLMGEMKRHRLFLVP